MEIWNDCDELQVVEKMEFRKEGGPLEGGGVERNE